MARTKTTTRYSYFGQDGLGGGLTSENPIYVSKNQMVVADNILVSTSLVRRKRGGQEKYHTGSYDTTASYPASGTATAARAIRGVTDYWRTASLSGIPTSDLFLHQSTNVWSIDDRTSVGVNRTGSLTLSGTSVPCYRAFNQKIYFCSTVTADGYNKWDGAAASAVAVTAPTDGVGKFLCTHLGRMVMAGQDSFPFRVYLSKPLDPEDWTTGGATSLDLDDDGDPQGITGLSSFQGRLYVFTRRSIYEITGTTAATFVVLRISNGIGALSHASIVQVPNDIIFASDRGVHSLRQVASGRQTESTFISRDIQKLWTELLNTSLYSRIWACYDDTINCYIVSVPSSGQLLNDQLLVFNIEFGIWTVWPDIQARSICNVILSNQKNILIGKETGVLALINKSTRSDFGEGYTARFKTGVLYPGSVETEKVFKSITVFASTTTEGQFSVGWNIDGKKYGSKTVNLITGQDVLGTTFVLGQSRLGIGQYVPHTISLDDIGYGIQVEIIVGGTSDLEFYGFILEVEDVNETYT